MSKQDGSTASLEGMRKWREAVPNDRLAHVVKDLMRTLQRGLQSRLAMHSVAIGQWTFLRILWERDGITQRELSELAGVSEPTTYSALLSMEKKGYITRLKLPSNLRNISVSLTPKGRELKAKLVPLAEDINAVMMAGLSNEEVAQFRHTLLRMIDQLERDELARAAKATASNPG
jgi:MarR family transcriptional regulator, organic hydroperoxide resistance regulator